MPQWSNTPERYGTMSIVLHWGMALLLVVLVALGFYMDSLPNVGFDTEKITLILVHKALGMLALAIAVIRLGWRLVNVLPRFVDGLPDWQQVAARFVHLMFYALLLAVPLTGWLMSSAGGYPVPFFNFFDVPDLMGTNEWLFQVLIAVHHWLSWLLLFFLVLHAGAALRHHFALRDDTLQRMLP